MNGAVAALAGMAFAVMGLCYYESGRRRVDLRVIALILCLAGALFSGLRAVPLPPGAYTLALFGCAAGLVNVALFLQTRAALSRGFLSGAWIAINLAFVLSVIFCAAVYNEPVTAAQKIGMSLGALCIVVLAGQQKGAAAGMSAPAGRLAYLVSLCILLSLTVCNSANLIIMKILAHRPLPDGGNLYARGSAFYLFVLYASTAAALFCIVLFQKTLRQQWRAALAPGLLAGLGSAAGMALISFCVGRGGGAAATFTVSSVVSILFNSLGAALWFKEKTGPAFWAGNALAVACVVLAL